MDDRLRRTLHNMPNWVRVTLDTTAPQVSLISTLGASPGKYLQVFYSVNEPGVVSATLVSGVRTLDLDVGAGVLSANVPEDFPLGLAQLYVAVEDAVANTATRQFEIVLTEAVEGYGAGHHPFTFGPIGKRVRLRIRGEIVERRPVTFSIKGRTGQIEHVKFDLLGQTSLAKQIRFTLSGQRTDAPHFATILREDEEIMMMLS